MSENAANTAKEAGRLNSTTSRNNEHNESAKFVQHRLKKQMATFNNLGSLENLKVIAEIGGGDTVKQRNSSLLRDMSVNRRRKSSSNPRQKLG